MWPCGIGVVWFVRRDDMDNGSSTATEGVDEALYLWNRAHDERDVPITLGIFSRTSGEAAVRMNEIILHINDDQGRFADLRPRHSGFHLQLLRGLAGVAWHDQVLASACQCLSQAASGRDC